MFYKEKRFISPAPIYARIKEEMKTYFNTGQIDDLMFPIWTKDCIDKFKNTYYKVQPAVMDIFNHKADLPCDFKAVREVYICATYNKGPVTHPFTYYYQTDCRVGSPLEGCSDCNRPDCNDADDTPSQPFGATPEAFPWVSSSLPVLCDTPDQFRITHKVQGSYMFSYSAVGLLKPGNHKTIRICCDNCPNIGCSAPDTFDIINDKIVTSFPTGTLYMSYYADTEMDNGYNEIPDEFEFKQYVYRYIRYMIYQQLYEQSMDETVNSLRVKKEEAEQKMNEQYIRAHTEAVGETVWDKQKAIVRSLNRHNRYRIR